MEKIASDVLRNNIDKISSAAVDPATLSTKLLAAGIIGDNDVIQATNQGTLECDRRRNLVFRMMGNGAPGVFETFVKILLNEQNWKWLGKVLEGTAYSL